MLSGKNSPFGLAIVFASARPSLAEFHANEAALFSFDLSNEFDRAIHASRNLNSVSDLDLIVATNLAGHCGRRRSSVVCEIAERGTLSRSEGRHVFYDATGVPLIACRD